ncbi:MAG TPA: hypothetical protein VHY91_16755 [Pirellulales bacterium]|jgi:hypothetical protein|nr:hypothetical protein [Pirellulales bacterium]
MDLDKALALPYATAKPLALSDIGEIEDQLGWGPTAPNTPEKLKAWCFSHLGLQQLEMFEHNPDAYKWRGVVADAWSAMFAIYTAAKGGFAPPPGKPTLGEIDDAKVALAKVVEWCDANMARVHPDDEQQVDVESRRDPIADLDRLGGRAERLCQMVNLCLSGVRSGDQKTIQLAIGQLFPESSGAPDPLANLSGLLASTAHFLPDGKFNLAAITPVDSRTACEAAFDLVFQFRVLCQSLFGFGENDGQLAINESIRERLSDGISTLGPIASDFDYAWLADAIRSEILTAKRAVAGAAGPSSLAALNRVSQTAAIEVAAGKEQPTGDPVRRRRPMYDRDHTFLEWYEMEGSETYHSHVGIQKKWNAQNRQHITREVVITGVKTAMRERSQAKNLFEAT